MADDAGPQAEQTTEQQGAAVEVSTSKSHIYICSQAAGNNAVTQLPSSIKPKEFYLLSWSSFPAHSLQKVAEPQPRTADSATIATSANLLMGSDHLLTKPPSVSNPPWPQSLCDHAKNRPADFATFVDKLMAALP